MPTSPLEIPSAVLKRELLRALAAFGTYLFLYSLWAWSGAGTAYDLLIRSSAVRFDAATKHFPAYTSFQAGRLGFFDSLIILVLAYAAVSTGMPLALRALRSLSQVLAIVVAHVAALTLHQWVWAARHVWTGDRIMILLPRERQMAIWLKYIVYEFGLQLAPFVIVGLWVYWNILSQGTRSVDRPASSGAGAGEPLTRRLTGRMTWLLTMATAILSVSAIFAWSARRERDPEHIRAHTWFAERFVRERNWTLAETQFRAAIAGGSRDVRVFLNLAETRRRQGDRSGAIVILEHGLEVVPDPAGKDILRRAIAAEMR